MREDRFDMYPMSEVMDDCDKMKDVANIVGFIQDAEDGYRAYAVKKDSKLYEMDGDEETGRVITLAELMESEIA